MTDKKLNTGTGGFELDGKVVTYDIGVERGELDDGDWDSGDVNVDNQKRDLSKITKVTLANYLHKTTLGKTRSSPEQSAATGNRYVVEQSSGSDFEELSTSTKEGLPIGPTRVPISAFKPNLGPLGENEQNSLRNNLPRPRWFGQPDVLKGMNRQNKKVIDGNDLLQSAVDNSKNSLKDDHPVKRYSTALMKNRWSSDTFFQQDFLTTDPDSPEELDKPIGALKYPLGKSYNKEYYEQKIAGKNLFGDGERLLTTRQLASIGPVLMARASGEPFFGNTDFDPNPLGLPLADLAASIVPGVAQLGLARVEEIKLRAIDVLNSMVVNTAGISDKSVTSIAPGITSAGSSILNSWGALNNPYDQFSGLGATGMQVLAIVLIASITLIPVLLTQFGPGGGGSLRDNNQTNTDLYGRLPFGAYRGGFSLGGSFKIASFFTPGFDVKQLFGFSHTSYPLQRCINVGILAFFNIPAAINPEFEARDRAILTLGAGTTQQNPESYVIFARAINRSFLQATDKLIKLDSTSPAAFIQNVLSFLEFLRESKILQALNTFAQLGDKLLTNDSTIDVNSVGRTLRHLGRLDDITDYEAAVKKSRLISENSIGPQNLHLAWSSFRSPDLLALPDCLAACPWGTRRNSLGRPILMPIIGTGASGIRSDAGLELKAGVYEELDDGDVRISDETRQRFERALNAEYVPFYFHDVRTNEIISFHAFLHSLGDSYSAAYDSIDAIGRVETIRAYKSTSRKIDLSFQVAALSHEDFNYMWLKINKLTTMMYPQFSAGRQAEDANFTITVPFSQQIAAAPLIRLRVGDVVRSNYSRFNLARLFGYGYSDNSLPDSTADTNSKRAAADKKIAVFKVKQKADQDAVAADDAKFDQRVNNAKLSNKPIGPATSEPEFEVTNVNTTYRTLTGHELEFPDHNLLALQFVSAGRRYPMPTAPIGMGSGGVSPADVDEYGAQLAKYIATAGAPAKAMYRVVVREGILARDAEQLASFKNSKKRGPKPKTTAGILKSAYGPAVKGKYKGLLGSVIWLNLADIKLSDKNMAALVSARVRPKATFTPDDQVGLAEAEDERAAAKYTAAAEGFMDPKNNVVVKSFESVGGEGLPGFIESMSFDWYSGTTWEIDSDRGKAPKMCKVTISFSPFHDITPGLDHVGANRAPIYNLGPHRRSGA